MELIVRLNPNITKRLKVLRRGGGNPAQAAEHAMRIINRALLGVSSPRQIGRLTKYGEARIPNCIKFDLVRGYRLIVIADKQFISFLFVGSHDECDHWIKNNAGLEDLPDSRIVPISQPNPQSNEKTLNREKQEVELVSDYDPPVLHDLKDSDLRRIFSGLCKG